MSWHASAARTAERLPDSVLQLEDQPPMTHDSTRLEVGEPPYLSSSVEALADLVGADVQGSGVDPAKLPIEVLKELYPLWELRDFPFPKAALRVCRLIEEGSLRPFTYWDRDPVRRQVKLCTHRGGMFRAHGVHGLVLNFARLSENAGKIIFPDDVLEVVPEVFQQITDGLRELIFEEELLPSPQAPSSQRRTLYDVGDGWAVLVMREGEEPPPELSGYHLVRGRTCHVGKNRLRAIVRMLENFPELENPFRRVRNPAEQVYLPSVAIEASVLVVVDPSRQVRR